jgi:HPt (histidine-containing phosphotransfer) domain-containing protein
LNEPNELGIPSEGLDPEVVSVFLTDTPAKIEELKLACRAGNSNAVRKLAHYLKGSAMYVNARQMSTLCAQVQSLANGEDKAGLTDALANLEQELASILAQLRQSRR